MNSDALVELLTSLREGSIDVATAVRALGSDPNRTARLDGASIDVDRARRCGFPEVVYGPGKPPETVATIFETLLANHGTAFATRIDADQAAAVLARFDEAIHDPVGRTMRIGTCPRVPGARVAVVSAGTTDRPVAVEAVETIRWMGCEANLVEDVGVAGPQRLPERMSEIAGAAAVVVAAGMEGALPSVVGGWVDVPVVAVPTSVGYGANLGGLAALLAMLNSCASNVTVVNVDAGFKAGYVAGLIATRTHSPNP